MKILILGAGAVGGYFGGRLIQQAANVTFLVRSGRAAQLAEKGLILEEPSGQSTCLQPVQTLVVPSDTSTPPVSAHPQFDVIIIACKAYSLQGAMDSLDALQLVHPKAAILPLLNGMAHMEVLQQRFSMATVWGGTCGIVATLKPDGTIQKMTEHHFIQAGQWTTNANEQKQTDKTLETLIQLMKEAGINANLSEDIHSNLWGKWTFLAALGAATCLFDATVGEIHSTDAGSEYLKGVYQECHQVARAHDQLKDNDPEAESKYKRVLGDPTSIVRASMSRDLQNGYPTEADHIVGDLIHRAKQKRVATPLLSIAYTRLQIHEKKRQQNSKE